MLKKRARGGKKTMGKVKGGTSGGVPRKELRKAHKQAAKEKKQQRHSLKQVKRGWCAVCRA